MEIAQRHLDIPFFSICIPQYNRTSFLIEACKSLLCQTFTDFEVCISDDCSTDGRESELLAFLEQSGLSFVYHRQNHNTRYDGNLRSAISLARGRYCFLLGNDDRIASPTTFAELHAEMCRYGSVGAVLTNYAEDANGVLYARVQRSGNLGSGPDVAVRYFRNFSFVSGIILDRVKAQQHATLHWDGSEMYQMFIGCRMIAEGGSLIGIDRVVIRKDIQVPGESVDSYISKKTPDLHCIIERQLPLTMLGRVVVDAIGSYLDSTERDKQIERIFIQILLFTYPFWIIEYRQVKSWQYALGVCLGMRPHYLLHGVNISYFRRVRIYIIYACITIFGILTPYKVFQIIRSQLYAFAKSF